MTTYNFKNIETSHDNNKRKSAIMVGYCFLSTVAAI